MRLKPSHSAFLMSVLFSLLCVFSVVAQEDRSNQGEADLGGVKTETDPGLSDSEGRMTNKPVTLKEIPKDSTQVKLVKPPKTNEKSAEKSAKDEDPLSFNFLYYIIEKFKLSDIIE